MPSARGLLSIAGSLAIASALHAGDDASHSHNLAALRHALEAGNADVHVLSDSIGLAVDQRYTPAIAWIIHDVTGELPTRVGAGAGDFGTRRRFGLGISSATTPEFNPINTQQDDPYLATDGRVPLVLGGQGQELPHDGSIAYSTMNGRTGTVARILANSAPSNGATTGGALVNVIRPGEENRVIADLFVRPGEDGPPDRLFTVQDFNRNGPVVGEFNPSLDLAGYRHLGEDPSSPRSGYLTDRMARIVPSFNITGQISANETLRAVIADAERTDDGSNAPVDDGSNLVFSGLMMSRADEQWNWVGGTAIYHHGGNSWNLDDFATDMTPTPAEPKRFTDDQWLAAMDAWTIDVARRSVYILTIAAENGSTPESVRDDAVSVIDRMTAVDQALGKPTPFFALINWHRQGNLDEQTQRDWYAGYEMAAMTRTNAAALDAVALLDYTVFDGSPEAQVYLDAKGLTSVTFGAIEGGDLTDADLVDDGTHQSDEIANAFFASVVRDAILSVGCDGDCDGSGTVDFSDLISMLFSIGQQGSPACDADESGVVDFNDLIATLFLFGPCA